MANEQDDKLNKLLARQGSIAERTKSARELDDDRLQIAAAYGDTLGKVIERANREERTAKEKGKNRVSVATG